MLRYASFGHINNPLLVFLHGFLGSKEDWGDIIDILKEQFYCLALDLPGHGSAFTSDFHRALDETLNSFAQPIVVGYSMGGRLALQYGYRQELPVIALSAHPGLIDELEKTRRKEEEKRWVDRLHQLPFSQFLTLWYEQPLFDSLRQKPAIFEKMLMRRLEQNAQTLAKSLQSYSLSSLPRVIPKRAFFLYGEEDLKYKTLYHNVLNSQQIYPIANSGHAAHLENPLACAQTIKDIVCIHQLSYTETT